LGHSVQATVLICISGQRCRPAFMFQHCTLPDSVSLQAIGVPLGFPSQVLTARCPLGGTSACGPKRTLSAEPGWVIKATPVPILRQVRARAVPATSINSVRTTKGDYQKYRRPLDKRLHVLAHFAEKRNASSTIRTSAKITIKVKACHSLY
jgi:hypothetical protein